MKTASKHGPRRTVGRNRQGGDFTQCHLWQAQTIPESKLRLRVVKTLVDDSHDVRSIKKCRDCGQLYLYEFHEEIDWINGEDPQYRSLTPLRSIAELHDPDGDLADRPRLQWDWLKEKETPHWVGRDDS
jgi:hypothetical protein